MGTISAPELKVGHTISGKTVRSVLRLHPFDVLAGKVQVTFVEGGVADFSWHERVEVDG